MNVDALHVGQVRQPLRLKVPTGQDIARNFAEALLGFALRKSRPNKQPCDAGQISVPNEQVLKLRDFDTTFEFPLRRGGLGQLSVSNRQILLPCLEGYFRLRFIGNLDPRFFQRNHSLALERTPGTKLKLESLCGRLDLLRAEEQARNPQPKIAERILRKFEGAQQVQLYVFWEWLCGRSR